jgi:hypothetical protein
MTQQPLELVKDQAKKSEPLFKSQSDYEQFRATFHQQVKPELDKHQEARRLSEEDAKRHLVF